ncbi:hypothetical protein FRZ67_14355 [Panacibacter ginsenosidivorans]|uniref:Beta-lactamase-inhibitor-like PepSY-like domain-containing protein n=1 Tax=Panacibacter ginsenosidivorans TaxID=1813871 RepID=A0A5B8VDR9_9BACT|nr:hypothetical protein [Panacibacter ginsenosidivorans]QEC68428.1 hypothetical protein FRZ67_14355 [Panacibacter ginsenosidivorans]
MKKIFLAASLLIAAATFTGFSSAHAAVTISVKSGGGVHIPASQVPVAVRASFAANFPTATNVRWERQTEHGRTQYQADFLMNGQRWRAVFASNGTLLSAGPR